MQNDQSKQNDQSNMLSRLNVWGAVIISAGTIIGALWWFFNPIGKVDLTIQIDRQIPVSLPSGVSSLPIRLVYEGRDITRASVIQVDI